jgi:hypothetical protein
MRAALRGLVFIAVAVVWISVGPALWDPVQNWGPREWFLYGSVCALGGAALGSIAWALTAYVRLRTQPPVSYDLPTGAIRR